MARDYTVMKLGDEYVAGVLPMNDEQMKGVPCQWCLYFMVDDIEAFIAKAKARAATPSSKRRTSSMFSSPASRIPKALPSC